MNSQAFTSSRPQSLVSTNTFEKPVKAPTRSKVRSATKSPDERKEVCFELNASSAREVLLAGDFTSWEKAPIKLRKGERDNWRATVKLAPGQYHYKFVVDGQWQDDPRATASCPNPFGGCNSILEIT